MPISDEYGSYTLRHGTFKMFWVISKHINVGLLTKAQSSSFNSLMIDEAIDQP